MAKQTGGVKSGKPKPKAKVGKLFAGYTNESGRIAAARNLDSKYPPKAGTPGAKKGPNRFRKKAEKDKRFDVKQAEKTLKKLRGY